MTRIILAVRRLLFVPNGSLCCKTGLHHTNIYQCPTLPHFNSHILTFRIQQKPNYRFSSTDVDDKKCKSPYEKLEAEATETLKNLNEAEKKELEALKVEYAVWKASLRRVPNEMTDYKWLMVMQAGTKTARSTIYSDLSRKERKRRSIESKRQPQTKNKAENDDSLNESSTNCYLRIIRPKPAKMVYSSLMFGNPLVFDFSLRKQAYIEAKYIVSLLQKCYYANSFHPEPFHFYFTGLPQKGFLADRLYLEFTDRCKYFIDFQEKDFCEIFPAKKLVYLSPNSPFTLEYSADDIYVIGALTDLHDPAPYSYARAKDLRIRTARFPVIGRRKKPEVYEVDEVVRLLLEMNYSHDWEKALRNLPLEHSVMKKKHSKKRVTPQWNRLTEMA